MVVNTIKENLCVNKKISTRKEIIFVEGDVIVPDAKPDVLNIICTSGVVCIYKKEIIDEKIKIEGNVDTYIMYMTDDSQERTRGINTNLDLSEVINISNITSEMESNICTNIKEIEAKVINERKITIKATIELTIEVYSKEEISIVNSLENTDEIKMLQEQLSVNSLIGSGETKIYAKENISIDNIDNLVEILKLNVGIGNKDIKISYNKVLTKAEAEVKIVYLTEDNRINKTMAVIPIIGFVDIQDVNEGNICDTNYEIRNMIVKPNSVEEHSVYIEMEINVTATAYEERIINIIQDLYSPSENIEFNKKTVRTIAGKREILETRDISERLKIEELQGRNIIDVDVAPNIIKQNIMGDKIIYNGELELRFMLMGEDLQMMVKKESISFEYNLDNISDGDSLNIRTNIEIGSQDFIIQEGGEVLANVQMRMHTMLDKNVNINTIDEVQTTGEREEQDYSIIMYIVKKDDSLWKIAKMFGSTVEDIAKVNGIEDENMIFPGQKLFIPRYKRKGMSSEQASMINYA